MTNLSPAMLDRIKLTAVLELSKAGLVTGEEAASLLAGHVDAALDRMFQHCGCIRVRITDDQVIEIYPRTTVQ